VSGEEAGGYKMDGELKKRDGLLTFKIITFLLLMKTVADSSVVKDIL